MQDEGVRHIVFSSTCATYGIPKVIPIPEEHPQNPINPYGASKGFLEQTLNWYGKAYGLKWAALRYFNAAGADPDGELGEVHHPESHLIPRVIQSALGQIPHVDVYGTDYPTSDGTAIRDYIHVADLAEAHVLALDYLLKDGESIALNLGTGEGHSVKEVIHMVEEVSRKPVSAKEVARRAGDPPLLVAQASKAKRVLGWQPKHSDLKTIIQTAWNWHSSRHTAAHRAEGFPGPSPLASRKGQLARRRFVAGVRGSVSKKRTQS